MPIKKKNLPEEPKLHINSMLANFYHRISQTKICEWKTEWIWVFRIHANGILSHLRIKTLSDLIISCVSFIHIEDTLKRSEITWQMYPIRIETVQSELFNHKIIYSSVLNVSHINVSASNSNRIIVCDRIIELFKKYFSRNIGPLIPFKRSWNQYDVLIHHEYKSHIFIYSLLF